MPRLPSAINVPTVPVARDPGVDIPKGAFDSTLGVAAEELQPALETFERAAVKADTRRDALDRSKKINEYNRDVDNALRDFNTERDLSDPEVLGEFGTFLSKRRRELLESHGGSEESSALLEMRLGDVSATIEGRAATIAAKIGFESVKTTFNDAMVPIADRVAQNPTREGINEGFLAVRTTLDDLRTTLDPAQETAFEAAGREQIALNVIDRQIQLGRLDVAEAMLEDGSLSLSLSAEAKRTQRRRINTAKTTKSALEQKVDFIEERIGPLSDTRFKQVVGLGQPSKRELFTELVGREPSEEEDTNFGLAGGLQNRSARIVMVPGGETFAVLMDQQGNFSDINTKEPVTLPPGALVVNTTQLSGSAEDILPKTEAEDLRSAEVATRNFVAAAGDAITLLKQSPNLNTFAGRAASIVNNMKQEARAIADALGVPFEESLIDPETFSDDFDRLGIENVRIRSLITSLAFQAAAASGQEGRAISDKDIQRFIQEIGSSSSDPRAFASALVDVANRSIRSLDTNFQVRTKKPGPKIDPPTNPFLIQGEEEITDEDLPEGITAQEWQVMTPEERALFKPREKSGG